MEGAKTTFIIFIFTIVLSLPLGLPITLAARSRLKVVRAIAKTYIWIFRGTPLLLQLFFFYFFFPLQLGIKMDGLTTVIVTFVLNYAAYFAEIYRGGMNSIDKGQYEAAYVLGLTKKQTLIDIILPQTMKAVLPPVVNETITLVKDTALASSIGIMELMKATNATVNRLTDMTPFAVAAVIYLVMTIALTLVASRVEKYFARYDQKEDV